LDDEPVARWADITVADMVAVVDNTVDVVVTEFFVKGASEEDMGVHGECAGTLRAKKWPLSQE
jgi:hypothetical protein